MKRLMWLWVRFGIGSLCLLITGMSGFAQVRLAWEARYNGPGDELDMLAAIALDHESNLYVTGKSAGLERLGDYTTLKYDAQGNLLWEARYQGTGNSWDYANAIALDNENNVYVTGASVGDGTSFDYATIKYDGQTGQPLWIARYNGPGNRFDTARSIKLDSEGNVYVAGFSMGIGTSYDYATIKYNGQTGRLLWIARYNGPGNGDDFARAIALDNEGNIYVTGSSIGVGTRDDYATVKYDGQTGQLLWIARYNGQENRDDSARLIASDRDGNIYVGGHSFGNSVTIRYDRHTGQPQWVAIYRGFYLTALAVDEQGGVFIAGGNAGDFMTLRYDRDTGQATWVQVIPDGMAVGLAIDQYNDVYMVGTVFNTATIRLVKYDGRAGQVLWLQDYPPGAVMTAPYSVMLDYQENIYVGGVWNKGSAYDDYLVLKYEQSPPGDVNLDFCVDDVDLLRILDTFGQSGNLPEDVNRDGVVDDQDLLMVLFNFGRGCDSG